MMPRRVSHFVLSIALLMLALFAGGCLGDGTGGGHSTPDAMPLTADAAPGTPDALPLYSACAKAEDCASRLCFSYGSKGMKCSHTCTPATAAMDCPPPATGCNGMGVCKVP